MTQNSNRIQETIRFLKWTSSHNEFWELLGETGNYNIDPGLIRALIRKLAEEHFYEMIFVLFALYKYEIFMIEAREEMLRDLMISELRDGKCAEVFNKMINLLK